MQLFFGGLMNETVKTQQIILQNGKFLTIGGVNAILAFDEDYLKLETTIGTIYINGKELKIENLSKDKKDVLVVGRITSLEIKGSAKVK